MGHMVFVLVNVSETSWYLELMIEQKLEYSTVPSPTRKYSSVLDAGLKSKNQPHTSPPKNVCVSVLSFPVMFSVLRMICVRISCSDMCDDMCSGA